MQTRPFAARAVASLMALPLLLLGVAAPAAGASSDPVVVQDRGAAATGDGATVVSADSVTVATGDGAAIATTQDGTGAAVATFRIAGTDRFDTAAKLAQLYWTQAPASDAVIVVNGEQAKGGVDALAAAYLAGVHDAPIVLVGTDTLPATVTAVLGAHHPRDIYVLGGETSVSAAVAAQLATLTASGADGVHRVAGADRFDTAAAVAASGVTVATLDGRRTAFLANGWSPVDALVAGPVAYRGYPVLLTSAGSLPAAASAAIVANDIEQVVVLGSVAAIADSVLAQVQALGVTTIRLGGVDRFATASAINAMASGGAGLAGTRVYLTDGWGFADALAVAPLAGLDGAMVLPVTTTSFPAASAVFLQTAAVTSAVALGGVERVQGWQLLAAATYARGGTPSYLGAETLAQPYGLAVVYTDGPPCGYQRSLWTGEQLSVHGCFAEAAPGQIYLSLSTREVDQAWALPTVRHTALHEIAHVLVYRTCGTAAPPVTQGRSESITEAYADLYLGTSAENHAYPTVAADYDVAALIHGGTCG